VSQHHISQFFSLPKDTTLDFFDANLVFDSPVFIDPFLLKNSRVQRERELFDRFGDYFRYAYDKSLLINSRNKDELRKLLTIHEPKNINMGYTEESNEGHGPSLAEKLLGFFIDNTAKRFVRETEAFPESKYNPVNLQVFTDRIGYDSISDITANLIMDYLIGYTQEQAALHGIGLKADMPLDQDGFDFDTMTWRGGNYYDLPENPMRPGEPLIFVPKRLLRGLEEMPNNTAGVVVKILRADPELATKFASLLTRPVKEIGIEDIRSVFKEDRSAHYRYLQALEKMRDEPYDFAIDPLNILADKDYDDYFKDTSLPNPSSCHDLKLLVDKLTGEFNREFSLRDGWRDGWKEANKKLKPQTEPAIGRRFRGMGFAFFSHFPEVSFIPETGTGNGFLDFSVIYKDCRVAIELKLLKNTSPKGKPPLAAYLHGVIRQLPQYVELIRATHAYYITCQHYDGTIDAKKNDGARITEVDQEARKAEAALKGHLKYFDGLTYVNVNMSQRPSSSKL